MPERPDLEYVVPILARELTGRTITRVDAPNPVVLRVAVRDPIGVVVGKKIEAVTKRAHFVVFALGDLTLVVSPMLAGRFLLAEATDKPPRDLAFTLAFDDDRELRELGGLEGERPDADPEPCAVDGAADALSLIHI